MYNTKILYSPVIEPALRASLVPFVVTVEAHVEYAVHVRGCKAHVTVFAQWIRTLHYMHHTGTCIHLVFVKIYKKSSECR